MPVMGHIMKSANRQNFRLNELTTSTTHKKLAKQNERAARLSLDEKEASFLTVESHVVVFIVPRQSRSAWTLDVRDLHCPAMSRHRALSGNSDGHEQPCRCIALLPPCRNAMPDISLLTYDISLLTYDISLLTCAVRFRSGSTSPARSQIFGTTLRR
eukprot:SAG11_NODE_9694_length_889_cov_1.331646_1_plen_157_part_00